MGTNNTQTPAKTGFTIVELLIVIIVVGILATLVLVAYSNVQTSARVTKMNNDLAALQKAIKAARTLDSKNLGAITGSYYTAGSCVSKAAGTDLAALPKTDSCWTSYASALDKISTAAQRDIRSLTDPWGRPYFIDENEGESGGCGKDSISAYAYPFNGSAQYSGVAIAVPRAAYTGCPKP